MKVKVVAKKDSYEFEQEMNRLICKFKNENKEIVDIKFGGCSFQHLHSGGRDMYSAMIIYKDN